MKKELKDYLPFYLGCECNTPDGVLILNGLNINDSRNQVWFYCRWNNKKTRYLPKQNAEILNKQSLVGKSFKYSQIKPILRPLSDMTYEERGELQKVVGWLDFKHYLNLRFYNPEMLLFLLPKHFDIFGLIESGLAVDKTTLPQY